MKEFNIGPNEAGQRMDKYLHKLLKEAPNSFLHKMLRKKNIVLNGKKSDGTEKLVEQDKVSIFLSDETFEKFSGITLRKTNNHENEFANPNRKKTQNDILSLKHMPEIIYEDEDILLLNKPVGMLSQKAQPSDISANEYVLAYLLESNQITAEELLTFKPSICNRLDRNTSGILIAGKSLKGLQQMSLALKERTMEKYYHCIVKGTIAEEYVLEGYLKKDEKHNKVQVLTQASAEAKYIKTGYKPLLCTKEATLLEVHLITGRSHQIRAHLASIGHPIAGDPKYGDLKWNRWLETNFKLRHQLLHAYKMIFDNGKEFCAGYPKDFLDIKETIFKK